MQAKIELGFDESRILLPEEIARRKREWAADTDFSGTTSCDPARVPTAWGANEVALESEQAIAACGAPNDLPEFIETATTQALLAELAAGEDFDAIGLRLHCTASELNAAIDRAIAE